MWMWIYMDIHGGCALSLPPPKIELYTALIMGQDIVSLSDGANIYITSLALLVLCSLMSLFCGSFWYKWILPFQIVPLQINRFFRKVGWSLIPWWICHGETKVFFVIPFQNHLLKGSRPMGTNSENFFFETTRTTRPLCSQRGRQALAPFLSNTTVSLSTLLWVW